MKRRAPIRNPKPADTAGLKSADEIRFYVGEFLYPDDAGYTDERRGEIMGISAGFVGMVLSGARPPSRKFLAAIGYEAVTLYREKTMNIIDPVTLDPRDPDHSREGIFVHHNCWRCQSGAKPCPDGQTGSLRNCEYPHARND